MRAALGASRGRIVAHVLTESVVLTVTAGVAGVAFAWCDVACPGCQSSQGLPRVEAISIDASSRPRSPLGIGLATAVAGLVPAWLLARGDVAAPLRSGGRGSLGGPGRRTRRALVVLRCRSRSPSSRRRVCRYALPVHLQSIDNCMVRTLSSLMELSPPQEHTARARSTSSSLSGRLQSSGLFPVSLGGDPGQQRTVLARMGNVTLLHRRRSERRKRWRQPVAEPRVDIPELFHDAGDRDGERSRVRRARQRRGAAW